MNTKTIAVRNTIVFYLKIKRGIQKYEVLAKIPDPINCCQKTKTKIKNCHSYDKKIKEKISNRDNGQHKLCYFALFFYIPFCRRLVEKVVQSQSVITFGTLFCREDQKLPSNFLTYSENNTSFVSSLVKLFTIARFSQKLTKNLL